jgi:putative acetyltransferase
VPDNAQTGKVPGQYLTSPIILTRHEHLIVFQRITVPVLNIPVGSVAYPDAVDLSLVGTYSALAKVGGGFVWDDVLEYRVWCHPERGSPDLEDGNDYYYPFGTHAEALAFSQSTEGAEALAFSQSTGGAEAPLALIRQREYIEEPNPGESLHVKQERITEWAVEHLSRPRRTQNTIPDFLSPNAPANRIDILRGLANPKATNQS